MMGIKDECWLTNPLDLVQQHLETDRDVVEEIQMGYKTILDNFENSSRVPVITSPADHPSLEGRLVKMVCMVQDMQEQEYLTKSFSVKSSSNEIARHTLLFQEPRLGDDYTFEADDGNYTSREVFTCVTVPGRTKWSEKVGQPSINMDSIMKCLRDIEKGGSEDINRDVNTSTEEREYGSGSLPVCIVKTYGESNPIFRLCNLVEVYGIYFNEKNGSPPVIHSVYTCPITSSSLLLHALNPSTRNDEIQFIRDNANNLRRHVLEILIDALGGDVLAANFVVVNLLSKIHSRQPQQIGQFGLNLCKLNKEQVDSLTEVFEKLVPKFVNVNLSIELLNTVGFGPKQDEHTLKLNRSVLQVSDNTSIVIDETSLESGKLNEQGIQNIHTLQRAIKQQCLNYQFPYCEKDYNVDFRFIVLSEGKSMFKCDAIIPVEPAQRTPTVQKLRSLSEEQLYHLRLYLSTVAYSTDFTMQPDVAEIIPQEYANLRKDNENIVLDDLHRMLTVARFLCLSHGKTELNLDCWEEAKNLELERQQRNAESNLDPSVMSYLEKQTNDAA